MGLAPLVSDTAAPASQKKVGLSVFICDRPDFKAKKVIGNKEGQRLMTIGSNLQDTAILNKCVSNTGISNSMRQNWWNYKEKYISPFPQ